MITFVVDRDLRLEAVGGSGLGDVDRKHFIAGNDESLVGCSVLCLVVDNPEVADFEAALVHGLAGHAGRTKLRIRDLWYDIYLEPVPGPAGETIGVAGVALNVSGEHQVRSALVHSQANLERASRIAGLAWWHYDIPSRRLTMSDGMRQIHPFANDATPGRETFMEFAHPDDRDGLRKTLVDAELRGRPCKGFDYRLRQRDGTYLWMLQQIEVVLDEAGRPLAMDGTLLDITERKLLEEHLRRLAHVDGLTGLANRTRLAECLKETIRSPGDRESTALLFIDVDGFKAVNDTYGHDAGDRLLKQIAQRIAACVRQDDFVARSGGDEFVVVVSPAGTRDDIARLAERIVDACAAPYAAESRELFTSVSIGVSVAPRDACTGEALLRNADSALYAAKLAGRNTFRFYTNSMHVAAARRLALENDLRRAIEREELSLVYQPIVSVDGRVRAIEALARWRHGTLGPVEPSVFIPIAEQTGMMREIGTYFAHEACRALRAWRANLPGLRLALNISAQQLDWDDLIPMLDGALGAAGLAHDALELEVTETVVMREVSRSAGILSELKDRGARISIDDFGTGYSSLAWLRDLPIDTIKVDRSFVAAMESDPESSIIVGSIISLGAAMSLDVVAEGVETERQISELSVLGCRLFQGYAFSRPVLGERIPAVIAALSSGDRLPPVE